MAPTFKSVDFLFTNGEAIDHTDAEPNVAERDLTKWSLIVRDVFDGNKRALAIDIDDAATAQLLFNARRNWVNAHQDAASGQMFYGTNMPVDIVPPTQDIE